MPERWQTVLDVFVPGLPRPGGSKTATVIARRDVDAARELETDDDAMDRIHRGLFRELLADSWPYGVETAIDVTLLGRYYERFADHAVSVARRVVYLVTGERYASELSSSG